MAKKGKGKPKGKPTNKAQVAKVITTLASKVGTANKSNKGRRVKPFATDKGAQVLAQAIAMVATLPRKGETPARDWVTQNPKACVVIDARDIVAKVKDSLYLRPENTVRARLISLAQVAPAIVSQVGYCRVLVNSQGNPNINPDNDNAYLVALFRK